MDQAQSQQVYAQARDDAWRKAFGHVVEFGVNAEAEGAVFWQHLQEVTQQRDDARTAIAQLMTEKQELEAQLDELRGAASPPAT